MKILLIGGCGYIGSSIYTRLSSKHDIVIVDTLRRGYLFENVPIVTQSYNTLAPELIQEFDMVMMFSGCSSVPESFAYPLRCWTDNVTDFVSFINKLPSHIPFIYASTAGVYNGLEGKCSEDITLLQPTNMYDFSKSTADRLAKELTPNKRILGLRLSTVNGPSQNLRPELMLNKMVNDAKTIREVKVCNMSAVRPIIGINDLVDFIEYLADAPSLITKAEVLNLASFSMSIGEIARQCAQIMDVPLVVTDDFPTYSFDVDTTKAKRYFGFVAKDTLESLVRSL